MSRTLVRPSSSTRNVPRARVPSTLKMTAYLRLGAVIWWTRARTCHPKAGSDGQLTGAVYSMWMLSAGSTTGQCHSWVDNQSRKSQEGAKKRRESTALENTHDQKRSPPHFSLAVSMSLSRSIVAIGLICSACTGRIGENPTRHGPSAGTGGSDFGTGGTNATGGGDPCKSAATRRIRRLSQREYFNVVNDLLGPEAVWRASGMLPPEPNIAGFDNQDVALRVASAFQEGIANVAQKLSGAVEGYKLAPCAVASGSPACLQTFAQSFARKAYGRNPTADELQRLLAVAATGESYAVSVQLLVETVLQSPYMLYATELGTDAPAAPPTVTLTPEEIATRLSLLLTGSRPDDDLLKAAEERRLSTNDDITSVVTRLLATPRSNQQLQLLVKGWINLGAVADAPKSPTVFPALTPAVVAAMQAEVDAFIDLKVDAGQGTFLSLMTDTSANIPPALAAIYENDLLSQGGVPTLDPERRRGILSLPGFLTYHSADQHSGPVERGLLIRRQLLCQPVPPPPPQVVQMISQRPVDPNDKAKTTRQKYEDHKTQAFCAACHVQFDPLGFGMEEMDGIGRHRTTENGLPVDSSGGIANTDVDGPFVGAAELSQKLASSRVFQTCFVWQFFRFAESRVPEASEECFVRDWTEALEKGGGHFRDLLATYVTRPEFVVRKEDR
jgi:hypothetical protein